MANFLLSEGEMDVVAKAALDELSKRPSDNNAEKTSTMIIVSKRNNVSTHHTGLRLIQPRLNQSLLIKPAALAT